MNSFIIEKPQFLLTGVSTRTTNAEEAGPDGRLPKLWETYFQSGLSSRPGIANPHLIYSLYTDYESDANGAYTTLIGHEVGDESQLAEDAASHTVMVAASKYRVFTTERGPMNEVVPKAWGYIWAYYKESQETRAYTGDFERYDTGSFDPMNTEVQIYIAIR